MNTLQYNVDTTTIIHWLLIHGQLVIEGNFIPLLYWFHEQTLLYGERKHSHVGPAESVAESFMKQQVVQINIY